MPADPADFIRYLKWSPVELMKQLAKTQQMIADLYEDQAEAKRQELEDRAQGLEQTVGTSVRARDQAMSYNARTSRQQLVEVEGHLNALKEERDFLRYLIGTRVAVPA